MADRDTVQLLVEVLGQEGIDRLARSTDNYKALLADLADKLKAGDVSAEEFTRTQAKLTTELEREEKLLARLKQTLEGVADGYRVLDRQIGSYSVSTDHVNRELDEHVRKAMDATAAQRAVARALQESEAAATGAAGKGGGGGGRGLMGASYALQDFLAVLTGGGGIARALGAVSNNFDQLAMTAGASIEKAAKLSIAFTGFTAALPILIPMLKDFWESIAGGEDAKAAEEKLKTIRTEIEQIRKGFEKLRDTPDDPEKASAEGFRMTLGERGNAGRARGAVFEALRKGGTENLPPEYLDLMRGANPLSVASDEELTKRANIEIGGPAQGENAVLYQRRLDARIRQMRQERQTAQHAAYGVVSEKIVQDAQIAGPAGDEARRRLLAATGNVPELRGLAQMTPEAIRAQQEEADREELEGAPGTEKFGDRMKEATARRKAREKRAAEVRALEAEYLEGNQDIDFNDRQRRKKAAREVEALEGQFLEGNQDIDFNDQQRAKRADSPAARRRAEKEARERQAAGLVANAPGIVGRAFGPQAAAMAANANPAEIQEMAERTARALERGQAPYQAVLDAFRQVAAAAERNAAQTQRFYSQLNGLQGRMHRGLDQSPLPSGLQR